MNYTPINFKEKLSIFSEHWSPKIIAQMNDYHFKLVKFKGDVVWHRHDDTDEVFINLDGEMSIEYGENMGILNCEFKVKTEMLGDELVGKGDEYRSPKYEIVSHERNFLVVKIFSSLASGVGYRDGSADIIDGFIHLFCTTEASDTIEFELLAWELTYTIEHDNDLCLDTIYFLDEKISKKTI